MNDQHVHGEEGAADAFEQGHSGDRFQVVVAEASFNFQTVGIQDPKPTGRKVIETAGYHPAAAYQKSLGHGSP